MQELFEAIQKADIDTCRRLLDEDPQRAAGRNEQGVSARLMALYCGQHEIAELLTTRGPELDLFEAAACGDLERLEATLQATEPPLPFSADGFSPLHLSAFFGRVDTARRLLAAGVDVHIEATNGSGLRPLNSAVAAGHLPVVHLLLEHGADIETPQHGDITPLMSAAAAGHREILELLLQRGATVDRRSTDGKTAADYAEERGHGELVAFLS